MGIRMPTGDASLRGLIRAPISRLLTRPFDRAPEPVSSGREMASQFDLAQMRCLRSGYVAAVRWSK